MAVTKVEPEKYLATPPPGYLQNFSVVRARSYGPTMTRGSKATAVVPCVPCSLETATLFLKGATGDCLYSSKGDWNLKRSGAALSVDASLLQ